MTVSPSATAREAAIAWRVCLSSGNASEAERHAFDAWLVASPSHLAAWRRLEAALGSALHAIDPQWLHSAGALRRSLLRPQDAQRRRLNKLLLAGGALFGGAAWVDRYIPLTHMTADYLTGTGQRRSVTLPDGSLLELDARTAASADFSVGRRLVRVQTGAVIITPAGATQVATRPLLIQTAHGQAWTHIGRVLMQCDQGRSLCVALAGQAAILTRAGQSGQLSESQGAWFDAQRIEPVMAAQSHAAAWQEGRIEVHDEPLQRVVDALARYRPGWIRVSPAASRLRISGLFPLDDTERALQALRHTQPITLRRFGRWLVLIEVTAGQA